MGDILLSVNSSVKLLVSIIIVNWNGRDLLDECLSAVNAQTSHNFEVILVDNGSKDNSLAFVHEKFPSVKTIALETNSGFTGGNIAGYQVAQGEYIVLLNNDACLCECWLEYMIEALESDECIGFCSSKIIISETNLIDSVGDTFTTAFTGTKIGEFSNECLHDSKVFVPGACAAAVIYKRKMLDDIGFLDDDFFLNHEDTDLNMRAWLAGWKCLFVPEAVVKHKVSASIGTLSDTSVYYFARNNEWVWIKNVPLQFLILNLPQRVLYDIASFGYFCMMQGKWRPFLKGKWHAVLGIPKMLAKRRQLSALRRLDANQIREMLVPLGLYLHRQLQVRHSVPSDLLNQV